jgi:hypothetical protein
MEFEAFGCWAQFPDIPVWAGRAYVILARCSKRCHIYKKILEPQLVDIGLDYEYEIVQRAFKALPHDV